MSINDIVRLDCIVQRAGQEIINSFHFQFTTNLGSDVDLLNDFSASCQVAYLGVLMTTDTLVGYEARQVWPGPLNNQRGPSALSRNVAGTRAPTGDLLPAWFAEDERVFTAGRGRSRHGRFFLPMGAEGDFTGDVPTAAWTTPRSAFNTNLFNAFGSGGTNPDYRLGVYSRRFAYVPNTHPPVFNTSATVSDVFRECISISPAGRLTTQRSRRA